MSIVATLIGDVVGSRESGDRAGLHRALQDVLDRANRTLRPAIPLRITVGDEYQGAFATLGEALRATLRLGVALAGDVGVRHGLGWGAVEVLSESPRIEDGPGWWAAREAIEEVERSQQKASSRTLRTAFVPAPDADGAPDRFAVNAALAARDELLAQLDRRGLSVLDGMLENVTQEEIATRLGISPGAVSQRVRRQGIAALVRVDEMLGQVR
jgi:hypothetical protein